MNLTKENNFNNYLNNNNQIDVKNHFRKITQLTILVSLILVPLLFAKRESFDYLIIRISVMLILTISFTIVMIKNIKYIGNIIHRDKINLFLLIYFILLLSSLPFSGDLTLSIFGRPKRFEGLITIALYLYLFVIARICPKLSNKHWVLIISTGLLVSLYGIVQFYGFYPLTEDVIRNFGGRPFSTMANPNFLGTYLVLILPISVYLYIMINSNYGLISFGILFYCLLCTNTRSAWLGAMATLGTFISIHYKIYRINKEQQNRYFILLITVLIIVLIFNYQTGGRLLNRFLTISHDAKNFLSNNEESDNAGAHRGFIWKRVVRMIFKKPIFGYGIENMLDPYIDLYEFDMIEKYGRIKYTDKAHNEYLNIAVTTGIPSLVIYLAFIASVLKKGWLNLKEDYSKLMLMSCLVGYLVQAFFNISMPVTAYVFWIFLGLITSDVIKL